jgi:EAL domain-containing protein (putative c-di-GMP-specific phosphodiesterase class I)/AmiR/NasT family two-component response regulator
VSNSEAYRANNRAASLKGASMLSDLWVLLVEDHAFQRRLALRLLVDLGVTQVLEASDGHEALRVLRGHGKPVDVALLDLDLPGMDGVELLRALADERLVASVAVVSALDQGLRHSVELLGRKSGLRVLGAVEKPLNPGKLANILGRFRQVEESAHEHVEVDIRPQDVVEALESDQIEPFFQPQAELSNGKVVAVEALARWHHPSGKILPAAAFLGAVEASGLSTRLTEIVLRRSLHWLRIWGSDGVRPKISINISPLELLDLEIADRMDDLVRSAGAAPEQILFELTEGVMLYNIVSEIDSLARLRLKGFGVGIDDFGTGHSSITKLMQLPFTELKIDRSFVDGCMNDIRKQAAIEAGLQLARRLNLTTVAEGVEHEDEWRFLASNGCDLAQGWLISRAVPGEHLADAIHQWRYEPTVGQ